MSRAATAEIPIDEADPDSDLTQVYARLPEDVVRRARALSRPPIAPSRISTISTDEQPERILPPYDAPPPAGQVVEEDLTRAFEPPPELLAQSARLEALRSPFPESTVALELVRTKTGGSSRVPPPPPILKARPSVGSPLIESEEALPDFRTRSQRWLGWLVAALLLAAVTAPIAAHFIHLSGPASSVRK